MRSQLRVIGYKLQTTRPMLGDLVALDPSIVSPGVAVFRNSILYANCVLKVPADTKLNHAERCSIASGAIVTWLGNNQVSTRSIAFEWPQIYLSDTPAVSNAVLYMIGVDMALVATLNAWSRMERVYSYLPAEVWHTLPKCKTRSAFASPRGKRVASRLSAAERAIAVDQHDAVDAVGIGLHALGRLGIRRAPYSSI